MPSKPTSKSKTATAKAKAKAKDDPAPAAVPANVPVEPKADMRPDTVPDPAPPQTAKANEAARVNPSGIYAFTRAEELGLSFSKTFAQQFVMRRDPDFRLVDFTRTRLGDWTLLTGNRLPLAQAHLQEAGLHVAFMGLGVDADGALVDDTLLQSKLDRLRDPQKLADDLNECGGRFVFVITGPGFERLYIDPSGIMGAVYNRTEGLVAATVHLAVTRPVELATDYPVAQSAAEGSGGRWAFGYTADRDVSRVLANHYLDLGRFDQTRHWPTEADDFSCPMREDVIRARLYDVIARHKAIMTALIKRNTPAILPITGGADSRLLLGFAREARDDVDLFFTHKTNFNTGRDMELAEVLADRAGVSLTKFDLVGEPTLERPRRMCNRMHRMEKLAEGLFDTGGPSPDRKKISERMVLPTGGVLLRGHVTDISKAVLWRQIGIREFVQSAGEIHTPRIGVRLLMTGAEDAETNPWLLDRYSAWADTLPQSARRRTLDFMGTEQFRAHGLGSLFYAFSHNFYMAPGCDRRIIRLLTSIPPHLRVDFHVNDMLLEQSAPELMDVPYTRKVDNDIRESRPSLSTLLARGPGVM